MLLSLETLETLDTLETLEMPGAQRFKYKTGFEPISKFDSRHALETLETCS